MLDFIIISKKPVINKALLHLVDKERSDDRFEVGVILEVNEKINLMTTEIRILFVLFFIREGIPLDQELKISVAFCFSK